MVYGTIHASSPLDFCDAVLPVGQDQLSCQDDWTDELSGAGQISATQHQGCRKVHIRLWYVIPQRASFLFLLVFLWLCLKFT